MTGGYGGLGAEHAACTETFSTGPRRMPPFGRRLAVDENCSTFVPYPVIEGEAHPGPAGEGRAGPNG